jgi:hypothetical protein
VTAKIFRRFPGFCPGDRTGNTAIPQFERRVVLQPLARGKARLI